MIIVMKPNAEESAVKKIITKIEEKGLHTHLSQGEEVLIIGVVGDKSKLDTNAICALPSVEKIVPITESYKLSNKKFHPEPMEFSVGSTKIGPNNITIMSGPCAVETEEQLLKIAHAVKKSGATILRGGAYKPRTSPYSFQGLEVEGLKYMQTAAKETGLATICEVTSAHAVESAESYKLSNKKFHPEPMESSVGSTKIGPNNITIMSGPCAVETEEQLLKIAHAVKKSGATILRGGAYKPRTSPYSFQGLEVEGLKYMQTAAKETGLATICEVTSAHAVESAEQYVSMLQVGARNMQNFELLKEVGRTGMPVLLKRGLSATIDEWLNAAEYIMAAGNSKVALCERGIRTFETATRNTLDLSAVCVLKEKTHLPVIVDPSHATGVRAYVEPLAKAAIACGADGLMIEVHNDPAHALSDGPQSLNFEQFDSVMNNIKPYIELSGRTL